MPLESSHDTGSHDTGSHEAEVHVNFVVQHEKFQSAPGSRVGTPAYLAPEVILTTKGKTYDGKVLPHSAIPMGLMSHVPVGKHEHAFILSVAANNACSRGTCCMVVQGYQALTIQRLDGKP